jgi:hypothetical protein
MVVIFIYIKRMCLSCQEHPRYYQTEQGIHFIITLPADEQRVIQRARIQYSSAKIIDDIWIEQA